MKRLKMVEAECIVRGYLEGSGLKDYKATGEICGIRLPEGMQQAEKLPEPIFTPSTKASEGHDINVSFDYVEKKIWQGACSRVEGKILALYNKASSTL